MRNINLNRNCLVALIALPLLAGCAGVGGDAMTTDLFSKDASWFEGAGRQMKRSVSIETPPLSPTTPVAQTDLVTADGACAGAPGQGDAAAAEGAGFGSVALGHTECDVVRSIGAPQNVALNANERGERVAVLTYMRGTHPGIYTFTRGRLTVVERAPEPAQPQRNQRRRS